MEKAIEDIVRTYLKQETEYGSMITIANKSNSKQQHQTNEQHIKIASAHNMQMQNPEKPYAEGGHSSQGSNNDHHEVVVDHEQVQLEQEFMQALYQCLEEKGVLKEIQAFIRQRLVLILRGAWPNLVQTKCDLESYPTLALIQDFLCTHKLLFTFSVFTSELVADEFKFRDDFGKMRAQDAEALLCELHIPKDTPQSSEILKQYFSHGHWSLLECIIHASAWKCDENEARKSGKLERKRKEHERSSDSDSEDEKPVHSVLQEKQLSLEEKLKRIDEHFDAMLRKDNETGNNFSHTMQSNTDKRMEAILKEFERDKEIQTSDRVQRFKNEELAKIRQEIEIKLKLEYLQKEKQLVQKYEEKVRRLQTQQVEHTEQRRQPQHPIRNKLDVESSAAGGGDELNHMSHENFHQSLLAKYNDLVAAAAVPEPLSLHNIAGYGLRRELERNYLLKEAALRNTIDKLKLENEQLAAKAKSTSHKDQVADILQKGQDRMLSNRPAAAVIIADAATPEDEDARAFLQYTVECQTEQIATLQKQVNELTVVASTKPVQPTPPPPQVGNVTTSASSMQQNGSTSLEQFLRDSKQRFTEIEQETQCVKARMRQLQAFSNTLLTSSPVTPAPTRRMEEMEKMIHITRPARLSEPIINVPNTNRHVPAANTSGAGQDRKVHFALPSLVDINLHSPTKPHNPVQGHEIQLASSADSDDSVPQQLQDRQTETEFNQYPSGHMTDTKTTKASELHSYSSTVQTEKNSGPVPVTSVHDSAMFTDNGTRTSRYSDNGGDGIQEPLVISKKAYLTGALTRDKVTSSSSADERVLGRSVHRPSVTEETKSNHGAIEPVAVTRPVPVPVARSFQPERPQPVKSLALSLLEDMEFETGKHSASDDDDEDDGLW